MGAISTQLNRKESMTLEMFQKPTRSSGQPESVANIGSSLIRKLDQHIFIFSLRGAPQRVNLTIHFYIQEA